MAFIFMDESGDLGFDFSKRKTSRFFVVTFLFASHKRPLEKIVKKIFSGFSKKQIRAHAGVLHCFKESKETRRRVLRELASRDVKILSIWLNKKKVYTRLQDEKHVLYNYVTNILLDRLYTRRLVPTDSTVKIVAARRETNQFLNLNFKDYLSRQARSQHSIQIDVSIETPAGEKCLQLADFVSWAIFRKRERGDDTYYRLIASKVVEESPLYP